MSDDLVARLRHAWDERERQLDEDERAALAWMPFGNPTDADRDHIARRDPARVLAEVERGRRDIAAKRRILDKLAETLATSSEYFTVESCDELDAILAENVLRLLAEAEGLA